MLISESGSPDMAMMLRLTIDSGQLGDADRAVYDRWFSKGSATARVLKLTNPDGQQDDLSFSVPPAAAQAAGKGGAAPPGSGTATTGTTAITAAAGGGAQAGARP